MNSEPARDGIDVDPKALRHMAQSAWQGKLERNELIGLSGFGLCVLTAEKVEKIAGLLESIDPLLAELGRLRSSRPEVPAEVLLAAKELAEEGWGGSEEVDEYDEEDWMDRSVSTIVRFIFSLSPEAVREV